MILTLKQIQKEENVMEIAPQGMQEFKHLLAKHSPQEGGNLTLVPNLKTWKMSEPYKLVPQVYEPCIFIGAQGKKNIYLDGKRYDYNPGNIMALFAPMPLECELIEASPENPLLVAVIQLDHNRISQMILKMKQAVPKLIQQDTPANVSGIFSAPLKQRLLDVMIRLLKTLDDPNEASILGESMIDEIYFRILSDEQGGMLKYHLQQRGQINEILRTVEYLHQNLDKSFCIDDLADIVNMSSSGFHKKFKEVMHLSPIQFAKSIKLNKAQSYILQGKNVSEAGYLVGYNSSAQFSREYKRFFGVPPSATASLLS
jgi:AraC-like DNA-binding protein